MLKAKNPIWFTENSCIRLSDSWMHIRLFLKGKFSVFDVLYLEDKIKEGSVYEFERIKYKGTLFSNENIILHPSDISDYLLSTGKKLIDFKEINYSGYLYKFNINPIMSYEFLRSEVQDYFMIKNKF
jgi:hypothetical protein